MQKKSVEVPKRVGEVEVEGRTFTITTTVYDTTGRLAVLINDGLSLHSRLSVNVPAAPLEEDQFLAKLVDENEQFREPLLSTGLFEDTGMRAEVGFLTCEIWRLLPPTPPASRH